MYWYFIWNVYLSVVYKDILFDILVCLYVKYKDCLSTTFIENAKSQLLNNRWMMCAGYLQLDVI